MNDFFGDDSFKEERSGADEIPQQNLSGRHILDRHPLGARSSLNQHSLDRVSSHSPLSHSPSSFSQASHSQGESIVSNNLARLWDRCLMRVRPRIEAHIFDAYVRPLRFVTFDQQSGSCRVLAPSKFVISYVDAHLLSLLMETVSATFGGLAVGGAPSISLLLEVDPSRASARVEPVWVSRDAAAARPVARATQTPGQSSSISQLNSVPNSSSTNRSSLFNQGSGSPFQPPPSHSPFGGQPSQGLPSNSLPTSVLSPRYTFDSFVVGSSNQFVHAAAQQVSENPGQQYNPLFIYGGVGLGKTHLLHAIGNAVLSRNPTARVLYLSSESFTNELIRCLHSGSMEDFKNRLRTIDVLLIDDIQFIAGKERTQEEFFHTFNALYSARKQIVLTADKMPQDIPGIEERLQTRFAWGLAADLQAPDFETRVAIVTKKCASDNVAIDFSVAQFVAEQVSSNVRELEGALNRLQAFASLQRKSIDMQLAEQALKPFTQKRVASLSSDDIKKAVANHFGVRTSDMVAKSRTKSVSFPRHIAMFLCRKHTTLSYPEIGGQFGGRDHSSVIHAANVVATKIKIDDGVRKIVQQIEDRLLGSN